jgi:hypothetical protein
MNKTTFLILVMIIPHLFLGCKKETVSIDERKSGIYLKRIIFRGMTISELEYDDNKYVIKEYQYNREPNVFDIHILYQYQKGKISEIQLFKKNKLSSIELFNYSADDNVNIIERIVYDKNELVESNRLLELHYDINNKLQTCFYLDSTGNQTGNKIEYYWENNNLIKIQEYNGNAIYVWEYEYDNKLNPYLKIGIPDYPEFWWVWYPTFLSQNNYIKRTIKELDYETLEEISNTVTEYEYTYYGNYPKQRKDKDSPFIYYFEYVYLD